MFSNTPPPPYYAVIFSSVRTTDTKGYSEMNARMNALALEQDEFLGMENAESEIGISISYWNDLESIKQWKANLDHRNAQEEGKKRWYSHYKVRIAKVECDYEFLNT